MTTLHAALAKVQTNLPPIGKGHEADTGKFTYTYASLRDVNDALLPVLLEHGLTWACLPQSDGRMVGLLTHVESGESLESSWRLPDTDDPQRLGSAITYGRRYLLCAVVGSVPDEDDDGAAAARRPQSRADRLRARALKWAGDDEQRRGQVVEWLSGFGAKHVEDLSDDELGAFAEQVAEWEAA